MANTQELIFWLLSNAEKLDLKMNRLAWIDDFAPGMTDLHVQIKIGGRSHEGWGASMNDDLALVKAAAEALERALLAEHGFANSNGMAAHMSAAAAEEAAKSELTERDSILCHYYGQRPFTSIAPESIPSPFMERISAWYKKEDLSFRLFELGPKGVLFVANGLKRKNQPFGFVLGAGLKETISASIESAALEATRQIAHLAVLPDGLKGKSLTEFLAIPKATFRNHGELALNLDYAAKIAPIFEGKKSSTAAQTNPLDPNSIESKLIRSQRPELEGCPLFFARATSPFAQDMFLGPPTPTNINVARISQFLGQETSFAQIPNLPHPFN